MEGIVNRETKDADKLVGRIHNWKFKSGLRYLEDQPAEVRELVEALANTLGDCGWVDGYLGTIIGAAVTQLIGEKEETKGG